MKKNVFRKGLVIGIIILFVGASVVPVISGNIGNMSSKVITKPNGTLDRKIIYVDDDNTEGPWDGTKEHPYQYIQDGVNASSDGDTIRVYSGIYYENVVVDVSVEIIGNGTQSTKINGSVGPNKYVVNITSNDVKISNFWFEGGYIIFIKEVNNIIVLDNLFQSNHNDIVIHYCDNSDIVINNNNFIPIEEGQYSGPAITVWESSNKIEILNNDFINKALGVIIWDSSNIKVLGNNFFESVMGISILNSNSNTIENNEFDGGFIDFSGLVGVSLINSEQNEIYYNNITQFTAGMSLVDTKRNIIKYNDIRNNEIGITTSLSNLDYIRYNNICNNLLWELAAITTIGWYLYNWWGSKAGCEGRIKTVASGINCFPWAMQEGPPWKNARTVPALYLQRIHELFPILRLLLLQRLGLQ